ncbi:hypothetical protein M892_11085 [Vibrio campbellii ATCC BAA-1116]|nr:hypothetical protein M892_11085 [Vibrio campbellii ATCC BAA-1116]
MASPILFQGTPNQTNKRIQIAVVLPREASFHELPKDVSLCSVGQT